MGEIQSPEFQWVPEVENTRCNVCGASTHRPRSDGNLYPHEEKGKEGLLPIDHFREQWIDVNPNYYEQQPGYIPNLYKGGRRWVWEREPRGGLQGWSPIRVLNSGPDHANTEPHAPGNSRWGWRRGYRNRYVRGHDTHRTTGMRNVIIDTEPQVLRRIPIIDYHHQDSCGPELGIGGDNSWATSFSDAHGKIFTTTPYKWLRNTEIPDRLKCHKKTINDSKDEELPRIKRCVVEREAQMKAFDEAYGYDSDTKSYGNWVRGKARDEHRERRESHIEPLELWKQLGQRCIRDQADDTFLYMQKCVNCDNIRDSNCLVLVPYKKDRDGTEYGLKYLNTLNTPHGKSISLKEWTTSDYQTENPKFLNAVEIQDFLYEENFIEAKYQSPVLEEEEKKEDDKEDVFAKLGRQRRRQRAKPASDRKKADAKIFGEPKDIINYIAEKLFNNEEYMLDVFAFLKGVCVAPETFLFLFRGLDEFKTGVAVPPQARKEARALRRNEICKYWFELINKMKNEQNDLSNDREGWLLRAFLNHLKKELTGLHPGVTYAVVCASGEKNVNWQHKVDNLELFNFLSEKSLNLIIIPESDVGDYVEEQLFHDCSYYDDNPTKCNRHRFCAYDFLTDDCHPVQD